MAVKFTLKGRTVPPDAETYRETIARLAKESDPAQMTTAFQVAAYAAQMADARADVGRRALQASVEQWSQISEVAARELKRLREERRKLRQSAMFAVQWTWKLLADLGGGDEGAPPIAEDAAIGWVLEEEWAEGKGDALAGELLAGQPPGWEFVGGPERFDGNAPLGYFVAVLREHVAAMRDAVGMGDGAELPDTEEEAMRAAAGPGKPLLWLDGRFAAWLEEAFPKTGPSLANDVKAKARDLWAHRQTTIDREAENGRLLRLWVDMTAATPASRLPFLQRLAFAVWRDVVRPEVEAAREAELLATPWLNLDLFDRHIEPVLTSKPRRLRAEADPHGTGAVVWRDRKRGDRALRERIGTFPNLDAGTVEAIAEAERGLVRLLRSPPGLRLIYFAAASAVARLAEPLADRTDTAPYIVVRFPGGLRKFARSLGCDVTRLGEILDAGRGYETERIRGLWTWDKGDPGKAAQACLTWNAGVFDGAGGRGLRVPLPNHARRLPDIGARVNGPAAVAWLLTHREMADHSVELCRNNAAPLDWRGVAERAGLSRPMADRLLAALIQGDDDGPFLLRDDDRDLYRLADDRAHRYLVQQGRIRLESSDAGKLGAEARRRSRAKAARKHQRKGTKTN